MERDPAAAPRVPEDGNVDDGLSFCWVEYVNHKFNYMYEKIYFPLYEWCVLSYYSYIYMYSLK